MKKTFSKIAITLGAVAALSIPALALAHGGGGEGGPGRWGRMTPEERAERRTEMLQKYDTDKDGQLSDAERDAARKDMITQRFKMLDANHDGVLSFDEFAAGHQGRHFGGGRHHGPEGEGGK